MNENIEFTIIEGVALSCFALVISSIFYFIPRFSIGKIIILEHTILESDSLLISPAKFILFIALTLTLITGAKITEISINELFSIKGYNQAKFLFSALFDPNLSIIKKVILASIETIYMAFMATFIAIPIAFMLCFFSAKNLMRGGIYPFIYFSIRLLMNFTRSIEPIIWAIIFSVWVGIGPFAGMLALMIHSITSLAKLFSESIEEIDIGPIEAIKATGASEILVIWHGVVPQVKNQFISYTIYRWDINVRMATIIGMVGGGGIGNLLMQYQGMARWNEVGTIVFVIAIIVWIMDFASAKIRENISQ